MHKSLAYFLLPRARLVPFNPFVRLGYPVFCADAKRHVVAIAAQFVVIIAGFQRDGCATNSAAIVA